MKMMITMPFYVNKPLKILFASALLTGLTACGTLPEKKPTTEVEAKSKQVEAAAKSEVKRLKKAYSIEELKALRNQAAAKALWPEYLEHTTAIWHKSDTNNQQKLEEQAWSIINTLSATQMQKIAQHPNQDVQAWFHLYNAFNSANIDFDMALNNLISFDQDAIFNGHLVEQLLANQPVQQEIKQLAVLLPMQGKYKVISHQIRSGIIKAFYASDQSIQIRFYDSSDINNLENIYTQAKQEGADRIIGPLRKQAIQELAAFHDNSMLALNKVEGISIPQFSFKSSDPSVQMRNRFEQSGYKRIGILTNDSKNSVAEAQKLQYLWKQAGHEAEISIYPNERPKLRDALGKLIHETSSKERKNNLRWLVGENLNFFPRTRQDLDAIVILDSEHRMAVFRPQFDFFALQVPLFSNSKMSPKNFQDIKPNKDLQEVQFLSYPAVLNPVDLINKFEAFGWDSFQVSTHMPQLEKGACLTDTKTGVLSMDGMLIKQKQVWAQYNKQGLLIEAPKVIASASSINAVVAPNTSTESVVDDKPQPQTAPQTPVNIQPPAELAPPEPNN